MTTDNGDWLSRITAHLDWFIDHAVWRDVGGISGLWWSMLGLKDGRPVGPERPAGVAKRCYRWIESPHGSNLLWDLPLVVACHAATDVTGDRRYALAARRYVQAYFDVGVSDSGLPWWGNHYYISAEHGGPIWFHGNQPPTPVDDGQRDGHLHETRPIPVPWPLLHEIDPQVSAAAMGAHDRHLAPEGGAGCFNRHADRRANDYAFLEAGAGLVQTFAWREQLLRDATSRSPARDVIRFSHGFRGPDTGLIPVSPLVERWDRYHTSSELGLWAGWLLEAAARLDDDQMAAIACESLACWLHYAWDADARRYRGRIRIADGGHDPTPKRTMYEPGVWSDPWQGLFPAHDYPMPCAQACLRAWHKTGDAVFAAGVAQWVEVLQATRPANNGWGACAECYGRAIHLLWEAGHALGRSDWLALASEVADEAVTVLACHGRLRGHPHEDRVDSVDGLGWLLLALLSLNADREPELHGLVW